MLLLHTLKHSAVYLLGLQKCRGDSMPSSRFLGPEQWLRGSEELISELWLQASGKEWGGVNNEMRIKIMEEIGLENNLGWTLCYMGFLSKRSVSMWTRKWGLIWYRVEARRGVLPSLPVHLGLRFPSCSRLAWPGPRDARAGKKEEDGRLAGKHIQH